VTEQKSTAGDAPRSAATRLFDIRLLIGGLFVVYGIMLTVAGFFTSDKERAKAAGLNINLWLGIGMLIVGAVFLAWFKLRPLRVEADVDTTDHPTDQPTEAPR
jgi:hypothetical protein